MNYHSHEFRDEVWTIISGTGRVILNEKERNVKPGDVIEMKAGCRHTIIAETELKVIEVQMGSDINVSDKIKYVYPAWFFILANSSSVSLSGFSRISFPIAIFPIS